MREQFDRVTDRSHTASMKYSFLEKEGLAPDTLPMWVADMDFETVPEVKECLTKIAEHGIYGYTGRTEAYKKAVCGWFLRRFGWKVQENWLISTPGVVCALAAAVRAFTKEGDGVMIQQPVYYPFRDVILRNGRNVVNNPLVESKEGYQMDFEDMEQKIVKDQVKLFLLCSPHNPVGRVWTTEELMKLAAVCERHQVLVVVDEIHCDFARKAFPFTPFGTLSGKVPARSVICTAPSKTFNLAGLQVSNVMIPDETLRKSFAAELNRCGIFGVGQFGLAACQTAYEKGEAWLEELLCYLEENYQYVRQFLAEHLPGVRLTQLQGTYLIWMDFRACGMDDTQLKSRMRDVAKLWLDEGPMFGPEGSGFMRMNIAVPRKTLQDAMGRLKNAFFRL